MNKGNHFFNSIYIEHQLCAKHCSRHYRYISEQNIQRPHSLGTCILLVKKPTIRNMIQSQLHRMLQGGKYYGEKKG